MYDRELELSRLDHFVEALDRLEKLPAKTHAAWLEEEEDGVMGYDTCPFGNGEDIENYAQCMNDVLDAGQNYLYPILGEDQEPDRTHLLDRVVMFKQHTGWPMTYDFSDVNKAVIVFLTRGYVNLSDASVILEVPTFGMGNH